jgi:hypothetical protein
MRIRNAGQDPARVALLEHLHGIVGELLGNAAAALERIPDFERKPRLGRQRFRADFGEIRCHARAQFAVALAMRRRSSIFFIASAAWKLFHAAPEASAELSAQL